MTSKHIPRVGVSEIFGPTLQGEGAFIGQPTIFVRTGGCDYRCHWCDSLHAVDPIYRRDWHPMSALEIWGEVARLSCKQPLLISLSGGNPALQPLWPLIEIGKRQGYKFTMETQGSVVKNWFSQLDFLTLSPKPPSSGMRVDWSQFEACILAAGDTCFVSIKIVIFDDGDYDFARDVARRYPDMPLFLQSGNPVPSVPDAPDALIDMDALVRRLDWLSQKVLQDGWFKVTVLPQLHVFLWGNKRGV